MRGGRSASLTRNSPLRASDPHVSLIGHITRAELTRHLESEGADEEVRVAVAGTGGASAWLVVLAILTIALAALLAALFVMAR